MTPSYNVNPKMLIFWTFSQLIIFKNRSNSDEQSWYHVLNRWSRVQCIKPPVVYAL